MPNAMVAAQPRSSSAGILGEIGGRQMQRQVIDLQAEIVGDADLVDRAPPAAASSTSRCVASTGRGETPWRAMP